jgi:hypothetical protein
MKKSLSIILALSCILLISSCKREDCEKNKYGTVSISNSSAYPYDIYVDGIYKMQISGGTISELKVDQGDYRSLYAVQASGYLLFPTEVYNELNVISCSDYSWQIP